MIVAGICSLQQQERTDVADAGFQTDLLALLDERVDGLQVTLCRFEVFAPIDRVVLVGLLGGLDIETSPFGRPLRSFEAAVTFPISDYLAEIGSSLEI
jgi:hypothetical protein